MVSTVNNYTLGRGKLYFAPFASGTQTPTGERYLGNTPEFSLTIEEEPLEHYSSDAGIRELDDSVSLQTTRTGSLTTDNISPENVALFFFGEKETVTVQAATGLTYTINNVEQDRFYPIGVDTDNPAGVRGIEYPGASATLFTVEDDGSTPQVFSAGDDYTLDPDSGLLYVVPGGAITDGTNLVISYSLRGSTRDRVISGNTPVEGSLRFVSANPKGEDAVIFMPWVKIAPNGDYALKGDEYQVIPFRLSILKKSGLAAIYRDGTPAYA